MTDILKIEKGIGGALLTVAARLVAASRFASRLRWGFWLRRYRDARGKT